MATNNTVEYGLRSVHYATMIFDTETNTYTYGDVKGLGKKAVSLSLDPSGDTTTKYADDQAVFVVTNNQGYTGTLTITNPTQEFLTEVFGVEVDNNGVQIENADNEIKTIALGFEIQGDKKARRVWLYNVKLKRGTTEKSTTEESVETTDYSFDYEARPRLDNRETMASLVVDPAIPESETAYDNWYDVVYEKNQVQP